MGVDDPNNDLPTFDVYFGRSEPLSRICRDTNSISLPGTSYLASGGHRRITRIVGNGGQLGDGQGNLGSVTTVASIANRSQSVPNCEIFPHPMQGIVPTGTLGRSVVRSEPEPFYPTMDIAA